MLRIISNSLSKQWRELWPQGVFRSSRFKTWPDVLTGIASGFYKRCYLQTGYYSPVADQRLGILTFSLGLRIISVAINEAFSLGTPGARQFLNHHACHYSRVVLLLRLACLKSADSRKAPLFHSLITFSPISPEWSDTNRQTRGTISSLCSI